MGHEIASVCFGGFPGTNRHLREVSRVSGLTRHVVVTASDDASSEIVFHADYLKTGSFRLVVFGGWHPVYAALVDAAAVGGAEVAVLWTSSAAQTGLSEEAAPLAAILRDQRIGRFFATSPEMVRPLAAAGRPSHALPLAFAPPDAVPERPPHSGPPVVSLFSAPHEYRRKNVLSCVFALGAQELPYTLYLNGLSETPAYRDHLDLAGVTYRDFGWMSDERYAEVLREVDVGLQVSLADAFNYVAAEHFAHGVPVLVSRSVPCARGLPDEARAWLVVDDADNPAEIGAKLGRLLAAPEQCRSLGRVVREHMKTLSAANARATTATLREALGERF